MACSMQWPADRGGPPPRRRAARPARPKAASPHRCNSGRPRPCGEAAHLAFDPLQPLGRALASDCMGAIYPPGKIRSLPADGEPCHTMRTSISHAAGPGPPLPRRAGTCQRSRLRHDGRSGDDAASPRPSRRRPISSARAAAAPSSPPIPRNISTLRRASPPRRCPPARSSPARCIPRCGRQGPGSCPICGMALEPEMPTADAGPNPELVDMTRRFWIGAAADGAGGRAGNGRPPVRLASASRRTQSNWVQLVVRHAGGAVGRLAVLRARRAVDRDPQPQHVHADRARHRRGLGLQRRRDACARTCFRRRSAAMTARSRSISRRPRSSPCWCCSARCWSCARASRPPARSARCSIWRRRPRISVTEHGDAVVALDAVAVGDRLRVRPGDKVPVDGELIEGRSHARRVDGDRRVDAGRARMSAPRSSAARSTAAAASSCAPRRSAATPCWRGSCRWWRRRSARARRSSASPTGSRHGSCRR